MRPRANPTAQYAKKLSAWRRSAPVEAAVKAYVRSLSKDGHLGEVDKFHRMSEWFEWRIAKLSQQNYPDPDTDLFLKWAMATLPPHLRPPPYVPTIPRGIRRSELLDPMTYRRPKTVLDIPFEAFANLFPFGAQEYTKGVAGLYCDDTESVAGRIVAAMQYLDDTAMMYPVIQIAYFSDRSHNPWPFHELATMLGRTGADLRARPFVAMQINDTVWINDWDDIKPTFLKAPGFMGFPRADEKVVKSTPFAAFVITPASKSRGGVVFAVRALPLHPPAGKSVGSMPPGWVYLEAKGQ